MALPQIIFPAGVDPPINQDANFQQNQLYVAFVNQQVTNLERFAIGVAAVSVQGSFALTVGQFASLAIRFMGLSGIPFTCTIPIQYPGASFFRLFLNQTPATMTLAGQAGGATVQIPTNSGAWVLYDGTNLNLIATTSGGGGGSQSNVDTVSPILTSGTTTMATNIKVYRVDTTSAVVTVNLPASGMADGEVHELEDDGHNVDTTPGVHTSPHAATLVGNGNNIWDPYTATSVSSIALTRDGQTVGVRWCQPKSFWVRQ